MFFINFIHSCTYRSYYTSNIIRSKNASSVYLSHLLLKKRNMHNNFVLSVRNVRHSTECSAPSWILVENVTPCGDKTMQLEKLEKLKKIKF